MPHRYLFRCDPKVGSNLKLDAERQRYLLKVMRLRNGDHLSCFDGKGTAFEAQVTNATKQQAELTVLSTEPTAPASRPAIHIALGLLKGQAMDRAVTLATELGAASITPLVSERVNVRLDAHRLNNKSMHWEKLIEAACEQSGRLHVPLLSEPVSLHQFVEDQSSSKIALQMQAPPLVPGDLADATTLLIGPEGGWSPSELDLFSRQEVALASISAQTLKAETAPGVALAIAHHGLALAKRDP